MSEHDGQVETPFNPAEEAVADAMLIAQAQTFKPILENSKLVNKSTDPTEQMEQKLAELSKGKCGKASVFALAYLIQKHFDLFENMMLIAAFRGESTVFHDPKQDFHVFFLVKDKTGIWYAGSPANHTASSDKKSPMTTIIKSDNLHEVMTTIQRNEGGSWPSTLFIKNKIHHDYKLPFVEVNNDDKPLNLGAYYIQKSEGVETGNFEELAVIHNFNYPY